MNSRSSRYQYRTGAKSKSKKQSTGLPWREGLFIFSIAVSLLLLLALFTYHGVHYEDVVANASGKGGAYIAEGFFYLLGYAAFLVPILIPYGVWAWCYSSRDDEAWHADDLLWRTFGLLLTVTSACGLLNLQKQAFYHHLPFSSGGIFGKVVSVGLVETFNKTGSTLLLFGLFLCGITLLTSLSWPWLIETMGNISLNGFAMFSNWWAERKEQRLLKQYAKEEKSSTRAKTKKTLIEADDENEEDDNERPIKVSRGRLEPVLISQDFPETSYVDNSSSKKTKAIVLKTQIKREIKKGLPSLDLLDQPEKLVGEKNYSPAALEEMSREVELRLKDFGIAVQVVAVHPGPVVTRYELQLAPGIKVSRITSLAKDLARSLSVISVRVVEVIPGKSVVGLELPNDHREIVRLSEVLASNQYEQSRSPVSLALGKDIAGHPVVVDLGKMPHLLVAGTTGSGKSVGLNAMLLSLLYKATPLEVRMIMIDPKMLELSIYEGIPHLLAPVVTDMKEAANALRWCVAEMDRRYKIMAHFGVRNLAGYNAKLAEAQTQGTPLTDPFWKSPDGVADQPPVLESLPYIVVVVDEFADMIMVVGKKVEELIARIAQKARAAGIHLILATQRPSVDVITGLIKANIPTRIAFQVSSKIDSRTILDQQGAEQLLGHGDMLYLAPGTGVPVRVHGAYVADQEVHKVVHDWQSRGQPDYVEGLFEDDDESIDAEGGAENAEGTEQDPLYDQAVEVVLETRRASISGVQRRLRIGYNRAARLLEEMENAGLVSSMEHNGSREILVPERAE